MNITNKNKMSCKRSRSINGDVVSVAAKLDNAIFEEVSGTPPPPRDGLKMFSEGGILKTAEGVEFMDGHHPLKSLAPRDVVARAIDSEMKRSGADCVYLDITHKPARFVMERFPNIYSTEIPYRSLSTA